MMHAFSVVTPIVNATCICERKGNITKVSSSRNKGFKDSLTNADQLCSVLYTYLKA